MTRTISDSMIVGVTGCIGSGKSTFAHALRDAMAARSGKDTIVLDADQAVHELFRLEERSSPPPPMGILASLAREFGSDLLAGGKLDRALLAERAFATVESGEKINAIIHPYVISQTKVKIAERPDADFILDVPLLFESGMDSMTAVDIVVSAPPAMRRDRARRIADFEKRDALQWPEERKSALADITIDNSGPPDALHKEAVAIAEKLLHPGSSVHKVL